MIIIKTKKGDVFVNEKETQIVQHDRENEWVVIRSHKEGPNCVVRDVEGIIYTNEAQPTQWMDEGSEVERLTKNCVKYRVMINKWRKIYDNINNDFFRFIVDMIHVAEHHREQLPADVLKAIIDRAEELKPKVLHYEYVDNVMGETNHECKTDD